MARTRIKFCGITRPEDLDVAQDLGIDAVGLVFCPTSPRSIDVQHACTLIDRCGPFITSVGLFMNQDAGTINSLLGEIQLDMLQFHGDEPEQFCASFGLPYLKSVAMGGDHQAMSELDYPSASALLLDSNEVGQPGGSGKQFNWENIPTIQKPIILAGGLSSENVAAAIKQVRPYAVDVSSGIESAKGIKDINKMNDFVSSVREADER
ncbi:MAG: phosphoribosylanthranilate isomerase [Gammaproteobacteria bacterium]|nr:phosphoribosylanthranilate isomerase [Gammaproteobacteria bacterium]